MTFRRTRFTLVFSVIGLLSLAACGDDVMGPGGPAGRDRSLNMTIEKGGETIVCAPPSPSLTAVKADPPVANDHYLVGGGEIIDGVFYTIELHVPAVPDVPHTFQVRPENASATRIGIEYGEVLDGEASPIFASTSAPGSVSGTVTITEASASWIAGEFALTISGDGTGGTSVRTISSGEFDMEVEPFVNPL